MAASADKRSDRDGKPFIRAAPNPVPFAADLGTATIAWDTGDGSPGWVDVRENEGAAKLFATGAAGRRPAPWITGRTSYRFTLSGDEARRRELARVTVTMEPPPANLTPGKAAALAAAATATAPFLAAAPNPVPLARGAGRTMLTWSTAGRGRGWIYLRTADGSEVPVASGPRGDTEVAWIQRDLAYRFTLYADEARTQPLAAVTVTMASPVRERLVDLALVGTAALAVVAAPVLLATRWRRWFGRAVRATASRPPSPVARAGP